MKYCKNCHRMSRDDDFCSHCGCAVYGDDDYTTDIDCDNYEDHSHEKESYSSPYTSHPTFSAQNNGKNPEAKKSGCLPVIAVIVFLWILFSVLRDLPLFLYDF